MFVMDMMCVLYVKLYATFSSAVLTVIGLPDILANWLSARDREEQIQEGQ